MAIVYLPHHFTPREYQKAVFKSRLLDNKKRLICIWHRRAGKDKALLNLAIMESQRRVGTYYYLFPELKQARRDIWEGIGADGQRFMDHFPANLVKYINKSEMLIEFHNGSIFRLGGSDRYDSLMGSNPIGIVFSEYSLQNPLAWEYLRPILAENGGWAIFNYTPRGMNHGFDLYETNKDNPTWFSQLLTVDDTRRDDGTPVLTEEIIQEERDSGMDEDKIQQEFYCSFSAAVHGAYFSKQLARADSENRISSFPVDTSFPVNTYWDLGWTDSTAIWFIQYSNGRYYAINYYENNNEPIQHFINYLHDFRAKNGIVYGKHFAPHDFASGAYKYGSGESLAQTCLKLGIRFEPPVPAPSLKLDAIHGARQIFEKVNFHKDNCRHGLACLREYHAHYNEYNQAYGKPVHNWASHGCFLGNTSILLKDGIKPIKDVAFGDFVSLSGVYGKVIKSGLVGYKPVIQITLSNGKVLNCTKEHKIFTTGGVVLADELCENDIVFTKEVPLCNLRSLEKSGIRKEYISNIMELNIDIGKKEIFSVPNLVANQFSCIASYGRKTMGYFLKVPRYIPWMVTKKILRQKIGESDQEDHKEIYPQNIRSKNLITLSTTSVPREVITAVKQSMNTCIVAFGNFIKGISPTDSMSTILITTNQTTTFPTYKSYLHLPILNFMQKLINGLGAKKIKNSLYKRVKKQPKYVRVVSISQVKGMYPVYDLTIEKHNCYYANEVLVSNSDAFLTFSQSLDLLGNQSNRGVVLKNRVRI